MAKGRELVGRIKTTENTRKITRTMELIATARFKKAMDRANAATAYTRRITALVTNLGVHFKLGRENGLLWVTTLDRGRPVADAEVAVWEERVAQLEARIERLGAVNLAAIEQFAQESERKAYLDSQHADLIEALTRRLFNHTEHGLNVPGRLVRTGSDWFWFRTPGQKQLGGYGIIQTGAAP